MNLGYEVGHPCGRPRCAGMIVINKCLCFLAAPCSRCTDDHRTCSNCGRDVLCKEHEDCLEEPELAAACLASQQSGEGLASPQDPPRGSQ